MGLVRRILTLRAFKSLSELINDENVKEKDIPLESRNWYDRVVDARIRQDEREAELQAELDEDNDESDAEAAW